MKKTLLFAAMLCAFAHAPLKAQRAISGFREVKTTQGKPVVIDGIERSEPDIYYVPAGDGTYTAVRLTVAPASGSSAAVTVPYLYMNTPNSIRVCWKTDKAAEGSVVRFGTTAENLEYSAIPSCKRIAGTYYWQTARLENLKPETDYYYQVESNGTVSKVYKFRTMPTAGKQGKLRVLFIGDHQRNEHSDYEWMLNAARQKVKEKYGDTPFVENIHFLMNVGDQVDAGRSELYEKVHLYKSRSVSPELPIMTAVGNHEYREDADLNLYDGHYHYGELEYQGISSGTAHYYAYQAGRVLFVVLNSDEPTAQQKMWVRKVIAAASTDENVDFIVSVQHRPLYAEQYSNDVSPWMKNEIMPILSSTPKHVLNCAGHHHLYARGQMTDTPVYHMISGGGVGTSAEGYEQLWGTTPDNRNHVEVQKTIDHWTYQIMEFDSESKEMTVETYSIGNSRLALDNVLVDKFTRKLGEAARPVAPVFGDVESPVALPHVFSQSEAVQGLHTVQYQISKNTDFTDIVLDKVVTAEDMYGVDGKYLPLDLNKETVLTELTVDNGALANGTYYLRARNRNMNLLWSDYSAPVTFTVEGAADPAKVTIDGKFFRTGSPITVSYAGAPLNTDAWVAVYGYGKRPGTSDLSYKYVYTDAASGDWNFTIDEPGVYFAVLFKDGGYTEISQRVEFVVSDNCDDDHTPALQTDKLVYEVGDPVEVAYTDATCISKDWIGIYDRSVVPADSKCPTYRYVEAGADGTMTLNVSGTINYSQPLSQGVYFVGYFNADGYHEAAERQYFVVGKPVMLDTDKKTYTESDAIHVVYEGAPGWDTDRILVYGNDGLVAERALTAVGGAETVGPLPAGEYDVCVATADGAEISQRAKITVTLTDAIHSVDGQQFEVAVDGTDVHVSSAAPIGRVSVFTMDGSVVGSVNAAGSTSVSIPVGSGKGVYLVSVGSGNTRKVVIK